MAKLSEEEAAKLAELRAKEEAPDEPESNGGAGTNRVLNISIDLGDEEQIKRGIGLGLLTPAQVEELDGGDGDGDGEGEEGPQRRGFFGDDK